MKHNALSCTFSIFLVSDFEHMCQTRWQYKKLETINALNIVSLDSTGSIVDNCIKRYTAVRVNGHEIVRVMGNMWLSGQKKLDSCQGKWTSGCQGKWEHVVVRAKGTRQLSG